MRAVLLEIEDGELPSEDGEIRPEISILKTRLNQTATEPCLTQVSSDHMTPQVSPSMDPLQTQTVKAESEGDQLAQQPGQPEVSFKLNAIVKAENETNCMVMKMENGSKLYAQCGKMSAQSQQGGIMLGMFIRKTDPIFALRLSVGPGFYL